MASPSVAYTWTAAQSNYFYAYLAIPGAGQNWSILPGIAANKPNGASFSVTSASHYTLSAYFDATFVTAGSPCFAVCTSSGSVIASASVAPGFKGSASATWTAAAAASVLYPVFSVAGVTIETDPTPGGGLVLSQPQVNAGASQSPFSTAASINSVPDPLFANWFTGKWGTTPPEWLPHTGALFSTNQPIITAALTPAAAASLSAYSALLYTAPAYSAASFVTGQSLGLVEYWTGTLNTAASTSISLQVGSALPNGQYVPLIQAKQSNGSVSAWTPASVAWFNILQGTSRLGLNLWGATSNFSRLQEDSDANQLDALADIIHTGLASQLNSFNPALGETFLATDTGTTYRGSGTAWMPILSRVDIDVLSTALPPAGNPGTYYHATDTDQIWRDNGVSLTQILTGPTVANFSGLAPSGLVVLYPAVWTGTAGHWQLNESAVPSGWLYCLGQPLSSLAYPDLFAVIGYSWTWQNTTSGQLVSGSGLTGDQGSTADYILWGSSSGTSSPSSSQTGHYANVQSGTTFCVPNLSQMNLGVPYQGGNTLSMSTTPPATVPIIKL